MEHENTLIFEIKVVQTNSRLHLQLPHHVVRNYKTLFTLHQTLVFTTKQNFWLIFA